MSSVATAVVSDLRSRHLSGVKSLLDEANVNVMPQCIKPSSAQVATFWNFARCDYLAAYINHTKTRFDTEDLSLWRSAGLRINDEGMVKTSMAGYSQFIGHNSGMREDMIANALVFILSKIVNLLASTTAPSEGEESHWQNLGHELDVWFEGLPESYTPLGRLDVDPKSPEPARAYFSEILYSIPLCSVTMQHYHLAKILLLLHTPRRMSNSVSYQLRSYREVPAKIEHHSREVCSIALGRPPGHVRIHMLQPIFVAGQCLDGPEERKIILQLLRDIETDLGWATEYRVQELLKEWGWNRDL